MWWTLWLLFCIPFYIADEVFAKKYMDKKTKFGSLKILMWFSIVTVVVAGIVYVFGLNESGESPLTVLNKYPQMLFLAVLYPLSLLLTYLAYKYLEISKVTAITYGNGVMVFIIITVSNLFTEDRSALYESLSLTKIMTVFFSIAGLLLMLCLAISKSEDEEKEKNKMSIIGIGLALSSVLISGIENMYDSYLAEINTIETFDYIGIYFSLAVVIGPILWLIISIGEKKPYNPFNLKQEKYALGSAICETCAIALFTVGASVDDNVMIVVTAFVPLAIMFVARKVFKERLKLEEYMSCIFLIISTALLALCYIFKI